MARDREGYGRRLAVFLLATLSGGWSAGCSQTSPFVLRDPGSLPHGSSFTVVEDAPPQGAGVVTFYALGDWGEGNAAQHGVAGVLRQDVGGIEGGRRVAPFVLGLGDNVYSDGLPRSEFLSAGAVALLVERFGLVYSGVEYAGEALTFHTVPGNHDYAQAIGVKADWGDRIHEETTAEHLFSGEAWDLADGKRPRFRSYPIDHDVAGAPDDDSAEEHEALRAVDLARVALPERVRVERLDGLRIIALDTQQLLNLYQQGKQQDARGIIASHQERLERLLAEGGEARWTVVMGHHAFATRGEHGGFRTWDQWLWSGTRSSFVQWIRPIAIGWATALSVVADRFLYRTIQDTSNGHYADFVAEFGAILAQGGADLYLSGHDHSLQLLEFRKDLFQVVSGSAAKLDAVGRDERTLFAHEALGFVRFDVDGDRMWLSYNAVDPDTSEGRVTARFLLDKTGR